MTIPMYIGIAAFLFIIGVVFILKGIPSEEEEKAVPISNPREIQELKKTFVPDGTNEPKLAAASEAVQAQQPQGDQFMEDNHRLRKEILDEKARYEELEQRMDALKKEYGQEKDQTEETLRALKEENRRFKTEQEQLSSNNGLLDELKTKTGLLETQYAESQKQQEEMKAMIEQLKTEKDDLLVKTKQNDEQASEQRRAQTIKANKTEFEMLSNKLIESISAIEELKRENKDLQTSNGNLSDRFKKTEELNDHLMKKEKMIQYELTKNRAQALGLEKICADFRTRIETMTGAATSNT